MIYAGRQSVGVVRIRVRGIPHRFRGTQPPSCLIWRLRLVPQEALQQDVSKCKGALSDNKRELQKYELLKVDYETEALQHQKVARRLIITEDEIKDLTSNLQVSEEHRHLLLTVDVMYWKIIRTGTKVVRRSWLKSYVIHNMSTWKLEWGCAPNVMDKKNPLLLGVKAT